MFSYVKSNLVLKNNINFTFLIVKKNILTVKLCQVINSKHLENLKLTFKC